MARKPNRYFDLDKLKNIGIINKIKKDLDSMYIEVKLDVTKRNKNLFFFGKRRRKLIPIIENLKIENIGLYDLCIAAKINKLKCNFEVTEDADKKSTSNLSVSAITLL